MKYLISILLILCVSTGVAAQKNLAIESLFGERFRNLENSTETIVTGEALKGTGLKTYRSLVITDSPMTAEEISSAVTKDGIKAISREVKYIDGKIYYAQFTLQPQGKDNRYIFYLNTNLKGGNRIMLVYMSGTASSEQIKQLLNKKQ